MNPVYQRMLCGKFGWNWPSGSGEEDENVKSLRQRRRRRQRRRTTFNRKKLTWAFGSGELKKIHEPHCSTEKQLLKMNKLTQSNRFFGSEFSLKVNVIIFSSLRNDSFKPIYPRMLCAKICWNWTEKNEVKIWIVYRQTEGWQLFRKLETWKAWESTRPVTIDFKQRLIYKKHFLLIINGIPHPSLYLTSVWWKG